jgi:AAHS family 4-hydroxybenzoate transporter-like MFS transporter
VFSAANFGVLIGSLVFSTIADKIGRRPVLVGATLFFAVMTIATAYAQNIDQLFWLRLVAGIGMGCIIPNATVDSLPPG